MIAVAQSASQADGHLNQVSRLPYVAYLPKLDALKGMSSLPHVSSFDWSIWTSLV